MSIPSTHEISYRIRFDEADATGHLRPSGLLRYAQDLAWQHSEIAGFDRDWYDARGTFWLVRMVNLRIGGAALYGDIIRATTEVVGWRRVWARRHTSFFAADASLLAEADTDWVLLTTKGRPTRIPDEISRYFAPGSIYKPGKVQLVPTPAAVAPLEVVIRSSQVDPLGHLNNAAYLDILDEAVAAIKGETTKHNKYEAEYIRPALPGHRLRVFAWHDDEGSHSVRMLDDADTEVFRAIVS